MSFELTLTSCRIGDVPRPATVDDNENEDEGEYEDEEEESPYAGISMSDEEKQAVLDLLRDAWTRAQDGWTRFRLETPDGPVSVQAAGLSEPLKFPMIKVRPRALTERIVDFVFALMRDANMYLRFDQDPSAGVVLSEQQRRRLTGHIRILEVCNTPAELLHYLEEKRDARLRFDPDAFNESWNDLADDAEAAGRTLVRDRKVGEEMFQRLIEKDPGNGFFYFARGRAYESLGETSLAAADYRSAVNLLHEGDLFQVAALRALARVTESRT
jgi:hypothetical protein